MTTFPGCGPESEASSESESTTTVSTTAEVYNGPVYAVNKAATAPTLDGTGADPAWESAELLTDFRFPWQDRPAPLTQFRALWDASFIYFQFDVEDPDLVIHEDPDKDRSVLGSDRVELFLSTNESLNPYYSLEMDPRAWVFSSIGTFPRNIDASWSWPGLETFASITEKGYILEGRIPMQSLTDLELWQDDAHKKLIVAVLRAEFDHMEDGSIKHNWISWIQPDSPKPDFHIPSAFGRWELK